jgi:hypothetical protein
MVLDTHLHGSVVDAMRDPDGRESAKVLDELLQVFEASGKV